MSGGHPDPALWAGRRVLLTGHTGFKGAWAALWLERLGARVTGLALPAEELSLYTLAQVGRSLESHVADLRDPAAVERVVQAADPEIVLHLAAQPIVRRSLAEPVETFATNVMGTVHLLDSLRRARGLRALLVVTSDKVYANAEDGRAFAETDRLGGKDPYSASKAACEIAVQAMAQSFLARNGVRVATARGGNVVGGGDFAEDRLVPDAVRAVRAGRALVLRHPEATRPWQHVLDCLAGYFAMAEALLAGTDLPPALNFGPLPGTDVTVGALARSILKALGGDGDYVHQPVPGSVEMTALAIDSALARRVLGWHDRLAGERLAKATADWYRAWIEGADARALTLSQIASFEALP
ncbi:CDP-glucose 4,6-dehydratase [Zavarzinia compransoris]|uniref:CDP-glucose 4,6-dehydratase n=1 Tax=Zavarzinia compransoris TaxID=1264899 RepID=A0A317E2H1_9PROT|nr:CDP-glucose 4,6-dehydratase [Zavarzinia compransoris]PWR20801.1 CDP-glucose 4,6-dehydratase [Zavarzinia compransoris]TDP44364.1 CDP-glucose 4,6-dehydratase [Zavarzinia compransoris]